ncbi:MAG: HAD hydrolase family protein [Candidatus Zixiibacteriota bacterium]
MKNSGKKHLTYEEFKARMKKVRLFAMDVDGVLTDDHIFFGPDGFELKKFNISDGFFIVLAMRAGLEIAVVSGRKSEATTTRMKDLGVKHVLQKMLDKRKQIAPLLEELGIAHSEVAFIGNEILDIGLAREVGLSIAVADAARELLDVVDYVTEAKGGDGAVREVIKAYFDGNGIDPSAHLI